MAKDSCCKIIKGKQYIYTFDPEIENPNKHLSFIINKSKKEILFFPEDGFIIKEIKITGFTSIPDILNENGYFNSGLGYYLNKKLKEINAYKFEIVRNGKSSIRRYKSLNKVVMNYNSLAIVHQALKNISSISKRDRSIAIDDFFSDEYPNNFNSLGLSGKRLAKQLMASLSDTVIKELMKEDIDKLLNFVQNLVKNRYKASEPKFEIFQAAKIRVDEITIEKVLSEFQALINENPNESKFGKFLNRNLYLLDSKYVSSIPQLNLVLGNARPVDFGLVDSGGFLDIFEIKKPSTPILAKRTDRGNYYWSPEAIKAIVQAEKYLYNAESKKDALANDIKRESGLQVNVVKPRAILVIGMSSEFKNDNMVEDFRILRMSLKNIDVVLYDELINRLKNQKNKIFYKEK
jgi:hypothetical protein